MWGKCLAYWNAEQSLLTSTKDALPFPREGGETNTLFSQRMVDFNVFFFSLLVLFLTSLRQPSAAQRQ